MPLPFATPELPGVAALFKAVPEDFRVDEIPAYLPFGEGSHLFLLVEKRGKNTREVAAAIAKALGVRERDTGIAGQKDRHAVTTQWLSVEGVDPSRAIGLSGDGFRILEAKLHRNKLRLGHLRGNRFQIRLRGVDEPGVEQVRTIAAALEVRGMPNYYGPQRFGRRGDNAEVGRLILQGSDDPRVRRAQRDPRMRRFLVSAFQSEVFNRVLAARLEDRSWDDPRPGDVIEKLASGGLFVCSEPAVDRERVQRFECSITGPLPGSRIDPAVQGEPAALEAHLLAEAGVTAEQLRGSADARGARRALRLPIHLEIDVDHEGLLLRFELPPGAYATAVLRELTKSAVAQELDAI